MKWRCCPKLFIFCIILSVNFISISQEPFNFKSDSIACDTFPPVRNFYGSTEWAAVYLYWDTPMLDSTNIPQNTIGFIIHRDFEEIDTVEYTGEETYQFWDNLSNTYPSYHYYHIITTYDLADCGLPGQVGHSISSDTLMFHPYQTFILSFYEDWSTGSFDPNLWEHDENWFVNGQYGNPMPCATYINYPDSAYRQGIVSYWINCWFHPGTSDKYIDGDICLEFDIKLNHMSSGATDFLDIELRDSSGWHDIHQYSTDTGSFGWSSQSFIVTEHAKGSNIKIAFVAHGDTNINITNWYIDNIQVFRQCNPPRELHWVVYDSIMAWSPPLPHTPTKGYNGKGLQGYNIYISYGSQYTFHSFTTDTFHIVDAVGWKSFYITAKYEDCEPASNEIFGPQSVPDIPGEAVLELFPNPCSNTLNVKSSLFVLSIQIYNARGELVLNKDLNNSEIDINTSNFPSGIYFVKFTTISSILLRKLLIKH